jgi:uncharacterized metal-binding protein YceD (DUF177 family)
LCDGGLRQENEAMKIHLKQIPAEGLQLDGEEDCPIPELAAEGIRCTGPLHYDLDVGISAGALWANGALSLPVELPCVACLEPFGLTVKVQSFTVHTELIGPETIDLTPFVREDILLNLPAYPRCDRDGGRVCKAPHLLEVKGGSKGVSLARRPPAWGELDKLKLKK